MPLYPQDNDSWEDEGYTVQDGRCSGLKCGEGRSAQGPFQVGFKIIDPDDDDYVDGWPYAYRCKVVDDAKRDKMCCPDGWKNDGTCEDPKATAPSLPDDATDPNPGNGGGGTAQPDDGQGDAPPGQPGQGPDPGGGTGNPPAVRPCNQSYCEYHWKRVSSRTGQRTKWVYEKDNCGGTVLGSGGIWYACGCDDQAEVVINPTRRLNLNDGSGLATIWRQPCISSEQPTNPPSNPPNIPPVTPNPGQPPAPAPSPDNPTGCTGLCNWTWGTITWPNSTGSTAGYEPPTKSCSAGCDCDWTTSAHRDSRTFTDAVVSSPCVGDTQGGAPPDPIAPDPDTPCAGECTYTWYAGTSDATGDYGEYRMVYKDCSNDCDCDQSQYVETHPNSFQQYLEIKEACVSAPGRGEPPFEEGEGCNGNCRFEWRWRRLPGDVDADGNVRPNGNGGYWGTGTCPGFTAPGGGVVNCICDPNHPVVSRTGWPESPLPGFEDRYTVHVPCVDAQNQRVSTNFASSYSNIMDFVDNIWDEYNQVRSASLVVYTPMSWQGEIGAEDNLEGMQNIIFDGLELKQVQDANNNSPMYTYSSVDGRASFGPVVHNVTVAKVDGASERTRLVTINLVDRASRMAVGSSNPELRDGEPGCSSRRAIYTWSGSEYTLREDCGGMGCQSGSVPTSYTEQTVYVACKDKEISSGVDGWPVKTISSVPPTAVQQLNNPAIATTDHQIKVLGPDGWLIAQRNSPTEAGAAATWPKKFSEIIPLGLKTTVVASGDIHPVGESTPLFYKVPNPSGQLSIDPSGNIIRVHPDTYKGAIHRGQMSVTPSSGVLGGYITHGPNEHTHYRSGNGSTSANIGTDTSNSSSTGSTGSGGSSDSGY